MTPRCGHTLKHARVCDVRCTHKYYHVMSEYVTSGCVHTLNHVRVCDVRVCTYVTPSDVTLYNAYLDLECMMMTKIEVEQKKLKRFLTYIRRLLQHAIVRTHQLVSVGDLCSNLHFRKWGKNVRFEPIWDPKFWNLTYITYIPISNRTQELLSSTYNSYIIFRFI